MTPEAAGEGHVPRESQFEILYQKALWEERDILHKFEALTTLDRVFFSDHEYSYPGLEKFRQAVSEMKDDLLKTRESVVGIRRFLRPLAAQEIEIENTAKQAIEAALSDQHELKLRRFFIAYGLSSENAMREFLERCVQFVRLDKKDIEDVDEYINEAIGASWELFTLFDQIDFNTSDRTHYAVGMIELVKVFKEEAKKLMPDEFIEEESNDEEVENTLEDIETAVSRACFVAGIDDSTRDIVLDIVDELDANDLWYITEQDNHFGTATALILARKMGRVPDTRIYELGRTIRQSLERIHFANRDELVEFFERVK